MTVVRRPLSLHVLTGERGRGARGMRFHESKSQCAIISLKAVLSPLIILSFRHAHLAMIINELLRSSTAKEKKHHYYHSTHPNDMSSALLCPWQIWCAQLFNMPNATCSSTHGVMWSVNWKMWFRRNRSLPLSLRNDSLIHIHNARWMWFPLSLSRSNCVNSTPLHWQQILDSVTAHRWREYRKRQKTREREKMPRNSRVVWQMRFACATCGPALSFSPRHMYLYIVQLNSHWRLNYHANDFSLDVPLRDIGKMPIVSSLFILWSSSRRVRW